MLKLKAQMQPATRRADGSVNIKFVTAEEIETDLFAEIDGYRQSNGWLLFKANDFDIKDIPDEDADIEEKPHIQLQKDLYKLHMESGGTSDTFKAYYKRQIRRYREVVWEQIDKKVKQNGND